MPADPCSIKRVGHQVIEQQVLIALSDKSKVALVLDVDGLGEVIAALDGHPSNSTLRTSLLADLRQLKAAAFTKE